MLQEHLRIPERGVLLLERFHRARQKPGLLFRRCECGLGPARQRLAAETEEVNHSLHFSGLRAVEVQSSDGFRPRPCEVLFLESSELQGRLSCRGRAFIEGSEFGASKSVENALCDFSCTDSLCIFVVVAHGGFCRELALVSDGSAH